MFFLKIFTKLLGSQSSFLELFVVFMDASSYDLLEFWLKNDSCDPYKKRGAHKTIENGKYFASVCQRSHISVAYGGHRHRREIEGMEKIPLFYQVETDRSYNDNDNDNASEEEYGMVS